ncbi:MAG TPA: hypothetical protein VK154_05020 [Chitinophagales bacterium]|nr:hypothetical protein [Chitinophagales bacterium]
MMNVFINTEFNVFPNLSTSTNLQMANGLQNSYIRAVSGVPQLWRTTRYSINQECLTA